MLTATALKVMLTEGAMKRVAVFGNAGGGKSTLSKRLADLTRLPLYPLDSIQFRAGGGKIPHEEYLKAHAGLLRQDAWIIDGFGCVTSAWERFSRADTLVYIDLPLITHHWWVTKRLICECLIDRRTTMKCDRGLALLRRSGREDQGTRLIVGDSRGLMNI